MWGISDVEDVRWKTILPFCGREAASAVVVVSTKVSKQIANMAAAVTNDTFRRLALLNPSLYNTLAPSHQRPRSPHALNVTMAAYTSGTGHASPRRCLCRPGLSGSGPPRYYNPINRQGGCPLNLSPLERPAFSLASGGPVPIGPGLC